MKSEVKKQLLIIFFLLFGIFSTLLVALGFKFYYAFSTNEPAMTDNYYEIGRNYDSYLTERSNTSNRILNITPSLSGIKSGSNSIIMNYLNTSGTASAPISQGTIVFEISKRATTKGRIKRECTTDLNGNCEINFNLNPGARYELSILAKDSDGSYYIKEFIEI